VWSIEPGALEPQAIGLAERAYSPMNWRDARF